MNSMATTVISSAPVTSWVTDASLPLAASPAATAVSYTHLTLPTTPYV